MRFEKWQALGNDYLILEVANLPWPITGARIRQICDPHTGVGSDGILLLDESEDPESVAVLRIFNPDGSEAALSGNGARQAIMYLRHRGFTDQDEFQIQTQAGPIRPRITGPTTCATDLGRATTASPDFPSGSHHGRAELYADGKRWRFQHVQVGNPQCAIRCDWLDGLDLPAIGPAIERHELFPNRTNVSWFRELERGVIRARIFERGVGETMSSGTGAAGAAIAYHLDGGPPAVTVKLDGGELLVEIEKDLRVTITGWAVPVYRAELSDEFVKELDAAE
ncbi:MAG TPA: diaminopimelate epimerase [Solirubrobacteraceae bacterium]|nr:diaminopimelate epimerase [Solirubrobacteraceae bacterium]